MTALAALGALSLAAWLALLAHPARPWDLRPVAEDEPEPPGPEEWPPVCVLVPARNEAAVLPQTLPALLGQDYPGPLRIVVVDDRSQDGTADTARRIGAEVVVGAPLPDGWAGKPWALEQGRSRARDAAYLLLTDADILHAPGSLRRLVAESEAAGLALNSRMARLRCRSAAERLLIPPFVFFFNVLYPMRRVNDPGNRLAAAAGGCVLLRRDALERIGGFGAIADEVIDDVNLARRVKALGEPLRLAVSREDVVSVRPHDSVASVWRMVRRTAFAQLRRSHGLAVLTLVGLALVFAVPPALAATGSLLGGAAWFAMTLAYVPAVRYFRLNPLWALTLPLAGLLYGLMTADSALRRR